MVQMTSISSCQDGVDTKYDLGQGHRNWSGWSGLGLTTVSQGKNKIPSFYKKKVINKSARVIFGLVRLVILQYSR